MNDTNDTDRGRGGPTVDLSGHIRALIRFLPVGIVVGIVAAIAVYAFQSSAATRYEATVVAQIVTPGVAATGQAGPTSTDAATAAGPFVALATDQQVLAGVARAAGVSGSADDLAKQISVTASQVPGIVQVTTDADSRGQASALADAVVATLDSTYLKRQLSASTTPSSSGGTSDGTAAGLAELSTQLTQLTSQLDGVINPDGTAQSMLTALTARLNQLRTQAGSGTSTTTSTTTAPATVQRLILLAQPASSVKAATIPPIAIAAVVGLIVMILVAEVLATLRSFRGRTVNPEWARRVGRRAHVPVDVARAEAGVAGASLATVARTPGSILVLSSGEVDDVIAQIASVARTGVDRYDIDDLSWNADDTERGLAMIVVAEGASSRSFVEAAVETLAARGIPARLVVVPRSRGDVSLPGGLALSFRKPSATAADAPIADKTPEPAVETAGPAVETPEPAVEKTGPAVETAGPAVETIEPVAEPTESASR